MPRPRSEEAKNKMLRATAELLYRDGIHAVTYDEVARKSGVAKTTIYRHFPSRNQLLVAAVDGSTATPLIPDNGNLRADLVDFLHAILPIFQNDDLRAMSLELMAAAARDPELQGLHRANVRARIGPLSTIFNRAKDRGEIGAELDYVDAFDFMEGPLIVRSLLYPDKLDDLDIELTVDRILRVLSP